MAVTLLGFSAGHKPGRQVDAGHVIGRRRRPAVSKGHVDGRLRRPEDYSVDRRRSLIRVVQQSPNVRHRERVPPFRLDQFHVAGIGGRKIVSPLSQ